MFKNLHPWGFPICSKQAPTIFDIQEIAFKSIYCAAVDNLRGPLFANFGTRVIYNLGRNLYAKVASIITNQKWQWPRRRNAVTREILRSTPASLTPHISQEDSVVWNLTANGRFSIKSAWNALRRVRTPHPVVNWSKVIWFKHAVHRWSIIQWMTVLGSLSTRDRLLKLGMLVDAQCVMCSAANETHEHLFFQCSFSSQVWKSVQQRLRPPCPFNDLPKIMGWMVQHGTDTQFHLS